MTVENVSMGSTRRYVVILFSLRRRNYRSANLEVPTEVPAFNNTFTK